jgi:hypothetical protein
MEKLDNWRERGLNDMMGGVLQVRREDELKKVGIIHEKSSSTYIFFFSRKFRSHRSLLKNRRTNGQKLKNNSINNIYKKLKNNKKKEINYEK